jgi:hypothetical protein
MQFPEIRKFTETLTPYQLAGILAALALASIVAAIMVVRRGVSVLPDLLESLTGEATTDAK